MTLQQAAQQALDVQNACNLSGVLRSFNEIVMDVLWPEAQRLGKGTEWVNHHPITALFLSKLASLNGTDCFCSSATSNYSRAAAEVEKLAAGKARQS
jgi:hypothetical protein